MVELRVGLASAKEAWRDEHDKVCFRPVEGRRVLTVTCPSDDPAAAAGDVAALLPYHTEEAALWVDCNDPAVCAAVAARVGCPVGAPPDVNSTYWTAAGPPTRREAQDR